MDRRCLPGARLRQGPLRHFLGRLNDGPLATATLFLEAGVAGVYFVFTAGHTRRHGIGAATTLTALREAKDLGYGVLGSSEVGYTVYRGLGFDEFCRIHFYEWRLSR